MVHTNGRRIHLGILIIITIITLGNILLTTNLYPQSKQVINSPGGKLKSDSLTQYFQSRIDSFFSKVYNYEGLVFQKNDLLEKSSNLTNQLQHLSDSLTKLNNFDISIICEDLKKSESQDKIKSRLKGLFDAINEITGEKETSEKEISQNATLINDINVELTTQQSEFEKNKLMFGKVSEQLEIPGKIIVNGISYRFYIAELNTDKVRIHNNPNGNQGQRFKDVVNRLMKQGDEPLMITNGGMYTPIYNAQGLLVENSKEFSKLDTLTPSNNLNFYLQPNGVFYVDSMGYNILTTSDYKTMVLNHNKLPQFATQSGPMLIVNGKRNSKFRKGSTNFYIRSGVGLMNSKKIVFIISDAPVNFFDFSTIFGDIFGCKNALYLDGAISEMYINEKLSGFANPKDNNGVFGPIISISKIKR